MSKATLACLFLLFSTLLGAQYKPWYCFLDFSLGAKALGMGNAFTAIADDPSAAYWNPAGLADLRGPTFTLNYRSVRLSHGTDTEQQVYEGVTETFDTSLSARRDRIDFFAIAVPARLGDLEWSFGFSYYPYLVYGIRGESVSTLTSSDPAQAPKTTRLTSGGSGGNDVLAFTAAFRIPRFLSFGVTLQQFFNTGTTQYQYLRRKSLHDDTFDERISGRNLVFGVIFTPLEQMRLGLTYHAGLKNKLTSRLFRVVRQESGEESTVQDTALGDITLPDHFSLGLAITPWPALTVSLEHAKVLWSKGQIENYFGDTSLPYPVKTHFSFTQQDIVSYRGGVEGRLPIAGRILSLRAGILSDRQLFLDQEGGAVTLRGVSLGAGLNLTATWRVDASLLRQRADWREKGTLDAKQTVGTRLRMTRLAFGVTYSFRGRDLLSGEQGSL